MAVHATPMVGRRIELELIRESLKALESGGPGCLAIEGEAGIGKTRLLEELRRLAQEAGYVVLDGSAAEYERDLPFGIWVDALDAYLTARADELDLPPANLASVAPSLAERHAQADGDGQGDRRHRTHRAVRCALELIAAERPLVLVLDDLHWCDAGSLGLISGLVRRGPDAPVLLAVGYRPGQVDRRFVATLTAADASMLAVDPLDEHDSTQLAGNAVDPAAIVAESGGNPFYILQLARAGTSPARSSSGDVVSLGADVPRSVAAALVQELENLSPPARTLLRAASIAGDPFEPELACEIAELEPEAGIAALDELLEVRMLHATAIPRRFAFRHPLVRRAVYSSIPAGRRSAGHARAGAALQARGATEAACASHVEQSAARGDPAAIAVLLRAGVADAPRAPAGAARWFAAALRLMPDKDVDARRQTLVELAGCLRSTGNLDQSAARLAEALELVPDEAIEERALLISACAGCEHFLGRHEQAERRLAECIAALPDTASPIAVRMLLAQSVGAFFSLDVDGGCAAGHRALETAQALGDRAMIAASSAALAHAAANAGQVDDAVAAVDAAVGLVDAMSDQVVALQIDSVNRIAWSEFLIERDADAVRHARRGIAIAHATGQDQFTPMICGALSHALLRLGDIDGATAAQAEALETAELAANDYVTCWVLMTTAAALAAAGDMAGSARASEQAVGLVAGHETGRIGVMIGVRHAITLRDLGATEAETEPLVAGAGGWALTRIPPSWRVPYLETLVGIDLRSGSLDVADARARAVRSDAVALGLPIATAIADRAEAAVALERGDAEAAARAATAGSEATGAPIEVAKAKALAARAHVQLRDRKRAISALREAEAVFDASGALRLRGETRQQLRRLGARFEPRGPSGAAGGGVDALSTREREVAHLIVERLTNREIAARLFLSEKTVESHLRNVFVKLGVSSRVDVARAVEAAASTADG